MKISIDAWGFVFESGLIDLYIKKSAIIGIAIVVVGSYAYRWYKNRDPK